MSEKICRNCAHADFKTPAEKQMPCFAHCNIGKEYWHYLPRSQMCTQGRFEPASEVVMSKREALFRKVEEGRAEWRKK